MPDLMQQGAALVDGVRRSHLAHEVTYRRGMEAAAVPATVGRTVFEQTDESGLYTRFESRDFIFSRSDLVLAGAEATPEAGDRIEESDGDLIRVYEVMAPGGESPWRWSDPHRTMMRVHTKLVSTEGGA